LYQDLDLPELTHSLLHAEEITFLSLSAQHVTNLNWGLFLYTGFDRGNEGSPVAVGSVVTQNGSLRHGNLPISNVNIESRLSIGYGYATGLAGLYGGLVSGALLVKFPSS
jgi:hypothetical protein